MDISDYLHSLTQARIRGQMDEQKKIMSQIQKQREDDFLTDLAIFAKRVGVDEVLRILSDIFADAAYDEKHNSIAKVKCDCHVCQQKGKT